MWLWGVKGGLSMVAAAAGQEKDIKRRDRARATHSADALATEAGLCPPNRTTRRVSQN